MKPAYRIPSMAEIRAVPPNGLTVVSTFSGCGGSCLGFRMAGFTTLWANEFVEAARETYAANFPDVPIDGSDIRTVDPAAVLEAVGRRQGEVDVLEGSPPCAAFSTAGKRAGSWNQVRKYSDTKQRVDDLFFEYVRLVRGIRPRAFVAENVSGLVKGVAKGYFKEILAALSGRGYVVEARVVDAQWLGVPQARQRLIFVGVRDDLGVRPVFPKPFAYRYSLRDALGDGIRIVGTTGTGFLRNKTFDPVGPAPTIMAGVGGGSNIYQIGVEIIAPPKRVIHAAGYRKGEEIAVDLPAPTVMAYGIADNKYSSVLTEPAESPDIGRFAIGREWDRLRPGEQSERYFNLVKPDPGRPCPTVTQKGGHRGAASVTHPTERRKFTIAELRRICGFPDDFVLTGTYRQQWERLGRAVPPPMMFAIAETVRGVLAANPARRTA